MIAFRFYIGAVHRVGAFNADPNPENLMLMADGRVAFLDYGSVRDVSRGPAPRRARARRARAAGSRMTARSPSAASSCWTSPRQAAELDGEVEDLIEQVSGLPPEA